MSKVRWLVLFAGCFSAHASTVLDGLRATLTEIRGKPREAGGSRGATPKLTVAKHQLRDWVESRLAELSVDGDEIAFERTLNRDLREAGICDSSAVDSQPRRVWTLLGCAKDVRVYRAREFLVMRTGLGIECGFDESAYLYERVEESWNRVWENEQDTYTEGVYKPQLLERVMVSEPDSATADRVVLTLGIEPTCTGNCHGLYYPAFRTAKDAEGLLLLEGTEFAFVDDPELIRGSVTIGDILVQFETSSIDGGFTPRTAIRHYSINFTTVNHVDPIALSPRDFVDEWIIHPWSEAATWTEPAVRKANVAWHERVTGLAFIGPTTHCHNKPDLWQVGVKDESKSLYFLVRWRPPYRFTMAAVTELPSPACTEEDPDADESRTLFPPANQIE